MKKLTVSFISFSFFVLVIPACKNKNTTNPGKVAKDIPSVIKQHTPGSVPTAETGYYMSARIDGKEWRAAFMLPDENSTGSYKIIHGETGKAYINFMLWRNGIAPGKAELFTEDNVANLSVENVPGFWGGKNGQVRITGVFEDWLEGTFNFEATSSSSPGKTIVVTEGSFRVPMQTRDNTNK